MIELIPQARQQTPHQELSKKYLTIPTNALVPAIESAGFHLHSQKVLSQKKTVYGRHLLTFRYRDEGVRIHDSIPEILVLNSLDGTTRLRIFLGMFRMVCENGLVVGDTFDDAVFKHRADRSYSLDSIVRMVEKSSKEFAGILDDVRWMSDIILSEPEKLEFARRALKLRWWNSEPLGSPSEVLTPKRGEDAKDDLWSVFNVLQENLVKGFESYDSRKDRMRSIRSIRGGEMDLWLNRHLWNLAVEYKG